MKKNKLIVIISIFQVIFLFFSGCTQQDNLTDEADENNVISNIVTLDSDKENTVFTKAGDDVDAFWMRSDWFYWNDVETSKDVFDWEFSDDFIKTHIDKNDCLLVVIFPFANWDQDTCHGDEYTEKTEKGKEKEFSNKMGKPCDMDEYKEYLSALVERYDGDGVDDMPDLRVPVKYWEICNEPSMQGQTTGGGGEPLKFFQGTSEEYVDILKASYTTIKNADPEAKVLHAGIAGMDQSFQDFWDPIYATENISDYFDIANIHSISSSDKREDLFIDKYNKFLAKHGIEDKPIWITELQIGELQNEAVDTASFNNQMVRSSVFALGLGADKLFHGITWSKEKETGTVSETATSKAYVTMVSFFNSYDSIEIIKQEYVENEGDYYGLTSVIGHYKFTKDGLVFYVLWGGTAIPEEITGTLKITDIYGNEQTMDASELTLTDEPVYVEIV